MKFNKEILAELRRQGFKRVHRYNHTNAGEECVIYEKIVDERKLDLQLWEDGNHRVSHWHTTRYTRHGCECTVPTDFKTVPELQKAIEIELSRTDHKD